MHELEDGVVYRSDAFTIIDTRAMPWVTFDGMGGSSSKLLTSFGDGTGEAMIGWIPPGRAQSIPDLPDRHYHQSVAEYFYLLGGEVYVWDYEEPADPDGVLVHYRPDYFLDRQPGPEGIHGLEEGPVAQCGTLFLNWRTGPGIWAGEPEFEKESIAVPYPSGKHRTITTAIHPQADGSGIVYSTPTVRILDTRAMAWEPYPELAPCAARKVLSRDQYGDPSVTVLSFSGPSVNPTDRPALFRTSVRECSYVLSGELAVREYPSPRQRPDEAKTVILKAGYFVDRHATAISEIATDVQTAGDVVLLHWTTDRFTSPRR